MRIKIVNEPPLAERHGVTEGREFETCAPPEGRSNEETWIISEEAVPVRLMGVEWEEIGDYKGKEE